MVVRVVGMLLVHVFVVLALAWVLQRRLIYLPAGAPAPAAEQLLDGGSAVRVHTDDGLDLTAWHAPATGPTTGVTVLVLPGNAGSRLARVPLARALAGAGFDVLLLDYRGYGGNPGSPTEDGLAADARAAHHHLVGERGVRADRLVLFGESLGAAVATRLARERPVAALVLRSPFTSLADVGARHYPFLPVRALLRTGFRSATPSARSRRRCMWSPAAPTRWSRPRRAGPSPPRRARPTSKCPTPVTTIPNWATARWSSTRSCGRAAESTTPGAQPSARAGFRAPPPR